MEPIGQPIRNILNMVIIDQYSFKISVPILSQNGQSGFGFGMFRIRDFKMLSQN